MIVAWLAVCWQWTNIGDRFLQNPLNADIYTEHSKECTVARYAPSGFYIASGGN